MAKGVKPPPSLLRIYTVLEKLYGYAVPKHGELTAWAKSGVLMLNATLTVRGGEANSHKDAGWQSFTDRVLSIVNAQQKHVVYILWGGFAHKKASLLDRANNLIIEDAHPSPMSGSAFNETKCFKLADEYLAKHGRPAVNWKIE